MDGEALVNLHELHTEHPLRDADFAAIRARVRSEIARREERSWLPIVLRFAFAAALVVLFVPEMPVEVERPLPNDASREPDRAKGGEPRVSHAVIPSVERGTWAGGAQCTCPTPHPPMTACEAIPSRREEAGAAASRTAALRNPEAPTQHAEAATRIEIITADPTIRIIWITPKENS